MEWWEILVIVFVLLALPPYVYIISKYAAAGWFSGVSLFVRRKKLQRLTEEVRNEQDADKAR